jgi:hypothetical protein
MKYLLIIPLIMSLYTHVSFAADDFVIIFGNKIQPRVGQAVSVVCFNNTEYKVKQTIVNERTNQTIDVNIHRPWFKLAYKGRCKGLKTVTSSEAVIDQSLPENVDYLSEGIESYPVKISNHSSYDRNLKEFYKDINTENFEPSFKSVTKKWPLGGNAFLIEQCFTVSANVKSFPSMGRDFVYGQKYKRTITNGDFKSILVDTDLNLTWAYCECDGNPPPTCKNIEQVTDINGNGKYEIRDGEQQPEGMTLQLQEYDGKDFSTVFEMCTGDFSYPNNDFSCPNK